MAIIIAAGAAAQMGTVYVANQGLNTASVVDAGTNAVSATVTVGTQPTSAGVNSVTSRAYVTNAQSLTVSVIDGATNNVIATIPVQRIPNGVAVSPLTNRVYVSTFSGFNGAGLLHVIDGATNAVVATIAGPGTGFNQALLDIDIDVQANRIYVPNPGQNTVSVVDGTTNAVLATIPVGARPIGAAVNPTTQRVYVTNFNAGTISVIDASTNAVLSTITLPSSSQPYGIDVNPTTNQVYVAKRQFNEVSIIDGSTNTVTATFTTTAIGNGAQLPVGVVVNKNTGRVYVTARAGGGNELLLAFTGSLSYIASVLVGPNPQGLAINPLTGSGGAVCGNDIVESGEQCDDGNTADGDCCSSTCQFESSSFAPCSTGQPGPCDTGQSICTNGVPSCQQTVFPQPEVCNGLDDDCNGAVDDLDADGDGQNDCDGSDACLGTISDTMTLVPNNHAWYSGPSFSTRDAKTKALVQSPYTMIQARGCSCKQILDSKPGGDKGQYKYGCTKGTMDNWVKPGGWATGAAVGEMQGQQRALGVVLVGLLVVAFLMAYGAGRGKKRR
ncbi:hypothetical protein HY642_05585 [Candidatus Woesearchaeota archaeon]|nr:hypothetical protein [Candidatus Woesearchaeota archaeon]